MTIDSWHQSQLQYAIRKDAREIPLLQLASRVLRTPEKPSYDYVARIPSPV